MGILGNDTANSLAWVVISLDADALDPNSPETQQTTSSIYSLACQ